MKIVEVIKLDRTDLTDIKLTMMEMFNKRSNRSNVKNTELVQNFWSCELAVLSAENKYESIILSNDKKEAFAAAMGHKEAWEKATQVVEAKESPVSAAAKKSKKALWFKSIRRSKGTPEQTEQAVRKHYRDVATEHATNYMKSIRRALV